MIPPQITRSSHVFANLFFLVASRMNRKRLISSTNPTDRKVPINADRYVWPEFLARITARLFLIVSGSGLLIQSFSVSTPISRYARTQIISSVTAAAATMLSTPARTSLPTSPFSNGFSVFFFISHLTRRTEIGRDIITHRIPIFSPFPRSSAIAAARIPTRSYYHADYHKNVT